MTGLEWGAIGLGLGMACLLASRWWARALDVREPKYVGLLKKGW